MKCQNYLFLILLSFSLILLASCTTTRHFEVCDVQGEVYQALVINHKEWVNHFENLPISTNNGIVIEIDNFPYVVRSFNRTDNDLPILSIATNEGYPKTHLGIAGYFFTPSGELSFSDDRYEVKDLDNNIYCYERTR